MKPFLFLLFVSALGVGCKQGNSTYGPQPGDSVEVINLLRDVYRWHDKYQDSLTDFSIIVKDSFQVGLNYDSLNKTIGALKQTNYFSSSFLDDYKKLADFVNNKLINANPKYLNEINFDFQDADPWTGFQDSAPDYWDKFKITEYKSTAEAASLKWLIYTKDWSSEAYSVRFLKENGKWKVSYLEGFDLNKYKK
jgi:hypothetical protein